RVRGASELDAADQRRAVDPVQPEAAGEITPDRRFENLAGRSHAHAPILRASWRTRDSPWRARDTLRQSGRSGSRANWDSAVALAFPRSFQRSLQRWTPILQAWERPVTQ